MCRQINHIILTISATLRVAHSLHFATSLRSRQSDSSYFLIKNVYEL